MLHLSLRGKEGKEQLGEINHPNSSRERRWHPGACPSSAEKMMVLGD